MPLKKSQLLAYTECAVSILLERGTFANGDGFRVTQRDALEAFLAHLRDKRLPIGERLGYTFELSMALGKTALYLSIFEEIYKLARADRRKITGAVVVPLHSIFDGIDAEIEKYAPGVAEHTTYYGNEYKELGGIFSVYTYNALVDLVEQNKIRHDVLFSDEAHRGTSHARTEIYISKFLGKILSIGLTATGAFDRDKTIQKTHGKYGFKRSSADSIRLGELAEYAQSQLHVIRVAPVKEEPIFTSDQEKSRYYANLRKKAWTATTRTILEHGKDEHTNDLLSDNISAFYCADIDHIQQTADELNKSPILKQKARAMGLDGVAVAIHSKMRRAERKAAKRAFDEGRYLAVVSDGVIKEGYNNSRIKNIFDYPRGSIVEKAQIIGRAFRKYWHPLKQRWEGATIIDTVVYHGEDDIISDQVVREGTILSVVTAWQILTDTAVFAQGSEPKEKKLNGTPLPPVSMDGISVESYTTIESVNIIRAHMDSPKNLRVLLDEHIGDKPTLREALIAEKERTGLGRKAIFSRLQRRLGKDNEQLTGLSLAVIGTWLSNPLIRSADPNLYRLVMEEYALADDHITIKRILLDKQTGGKATPREQLIMEWKRTNLGFKSIFSCLEARHGENSPKLQGLSATAIQSWLIQPKIKSASADHYKLVMDEYALADDNRLENQIHLDANSANQPTARERLIAQSKRTGLAGELLFQRLEQRFGKNNAKLEGLSGAIIQRWLNSPTVKYANPSHFQLTIDEYALIGDKPLDERIMLDDSIGNQPTPRQKLALEIKRTNLGAKAIFRKLLARHGNSNPIVNGLSVLMIEGWRNEGGTTKSASADHYKLVMNEYEQTDDHKAVERIILDEQQKNKPSPRERLLSEMSRTGVGYKVMYARLESRLGKKHPRMQGLELFTINNWLKAKSADLKLFNLVMEEYAMIEDQDAPSRPSTKKSVKTGKKQQL